MSISCNLLHLPFPKTLKPTTLRRRLLPSIAAAAASSSSTGVGSVELTYAVIDPAVAHANILCFRSGYNVQIVVDEDEPEEVLLRRFKREVSKAGVIQECKRRLFFENKQEEKKRKKREAGRRNRRSGGMHKIDVIHICFLLSHMSNRKLLVACRRLGQRVNSSSPRSDDDATKKARDDDDDNWDLPEGGLPF